MSAVIEREDAGYSVYGVPQVQYRISGEAVDYDIALARSAIGRSVAIEESLDAVTEMVRTRQRIVSDLGGSLAVIAQAIATLPVKTPKSSDKSSGIGELPAVAAVLSKYGISLSLTDGNKVKREEAEMVRIKIESTIDNVNNDLQQDVISLQSGVNRRDSAFQDVAKLLKRIVKPGNTITDAIGQ